MNLLDFFEVGYYGAAVEGDLIGQVRSGKIQI
jgi:hypothetical protein